jgi:probable F420-dependent oxidoreductase
VKFGLFYANVGPFAAPEIFQVMVRTAEEVGIESIWTTEHVVVPAEYRSRYPYTKDGRMPGQPDSPIPDPILPLAYAAAITEKLRLATGIVILPQRHPAYVAKDFATLDVLSRGRAILGVGIGWLEEEFEVIGVPFRERAARTEEAIRAIRSLWRDGAEPFEGEFFNWKPAHCSPKPVQKPGVPIVLGGTVEAAARRAARIGDGFFPARGSFKTMPPLLQALRDECEEIGRNPEEIEITTHSDRLDPESLSRYRDLGVARMLIAPPAWDAEGLRRGLEEFGERVIAKQ